MIYIVSFWLLNMIVVARQKNMTADWFFVKGIVTVEKFTWSSIYIFQKTVLEMLLYLNSGYCIYWRTCNGQIECLNVPLVVDHTIVDYISLRPESSSMIIQHWSCLHWSAIDLDFSKKWGILSLISHGYIQIEPVVQYMFFVLKYRFYFWFM